MDHAVFAGTNFGVTILLARWMSPSEYGVFAVYYSLFLFLAGLHTALISEPMSVLGPAYYSAELPRYFVDVVRIHFAITVPVAGAIGLCSLLANGSHRATTLAAAVLVPAVLLFWLMRRACYTAMKPASALQASAVYGITLMSGILLLQKFGVLSTTTAFVLMSAAVIAPSGHWVSAQISPSENQEGRWGAVLRHHWQFGRWIVAGSLCSVGMYYAQTVAVAAWLDLESAGTLRAMMNFVLPMTQVVTAMSVLALPSLARNFATGNLASLRRNAVLVTGVLLAGSVGYQALIAVFGARLDTVLYAGRYSEQVWLASWLATIAVLSAAASGGSLVLRAIQRPEHFFIANAASGLSGLVAVFAFIPRWGLKGAVVATIVPYAVAVVVAALLVAAWWPGKGGTACEPSGTGATQG